MERKVKAVWSECLWNPNDITQLSGCWGLEHLRGLRQYEKYSHKNWLLNNIHLGGGNSGGLWYAAKIITTPITQLSSLFLLVLYLKSHFSFEQNRLYGGIQIVENMMSRASIVRLLSTSSGELLRFFVNNRIAILTKCLSCESDT